MLKDQENQQKCQVPEEIQSKILRLKADLYTNGSIVREIKHITKDKVLAQSYVNQTLGLRKAILTANPRIYKDEGRKLIFIGLIIIALPVLIVSIFPSLLFIRGTILAGPMFIIIGIIKYFGFLK